MTEIVYKNTVIPLNAWESILNNEKEHPGLTCEKFTKWIEASRPGEKFCYHTGCYVAGSRIARIAFRAYENGIVTLTQKRMDDKGNFQYWAQKKRRKD